MRHLTTEELEAGLEQIRRSPADEGTLDLIVARAAVDQRTVLPQAQLDPQVGLQGDGWLARSLESDQDAAPRPETQLTIMNSRSIALLAQEKERWPLAGDQLFIDLDLSDENLPCGSRLAIGTAIIEITAEAHNGCAKFTKRFGLEAMKFVNSTIGKQYHLRGIYAKVIRPGRISAGDQVNKIESHVEQ